jgi:TetR/AcrR family transcriptional repressor of nem operon
MTDVLTRDKILLAAYDLIREMGVNGISYTDISDIVKIRKASIHHHFPSKQDLIRELVCQYSYDFFEQLAHIRQVGVNGFNILQAYFGLFEQTFEEGRGGSICLFGMLGAELQSLDEPTSAVVKSFYCRNLAALTEILQVGFADKSLREEEKPLELARVIFSAVEGAMIIVRADGEIANYRRVTNQLLRIVAA